MRLGFLGTGAIAEAVVSGLSGGPQPPAILVSPRNADRSRALAERFQNVAVGADNQAVVDGADMIFIAIRPQQIDAVLGPLRFRPDQRVASFAALYPMRRLEAAVAPVPAASICRVLPLPASALRIGPVAIWPMLPDVAAVLGRVGRIMPVAEEGLLEPIWATTALMAPFYDQLACVADWAVENGVSAELARQYVGEMHEAWVRVALSSGDGFDRLRDTSQTPGGLNEQALRKLTQSGHTDRLKEVLDRVLDRLRAAGK
jgi:pyrroline-5-carboxylate reductase